VQSRPKRVLQSLEVYVKENGERIDLETLRAALLTNDSVEEFSLILRDPAMLNLHQSKRVRRKRLFKASEESTPHNCNL
jgi:hypothetical protein